MTKTEMLMDRWAGIGRMSNKKTFKPGDKFILELGEERKMFDEFEIEETDLYVKKDLLEKLTPYKDPEIIHCRDCNFSHMTYDGDVKYCDIWFPDKACYVGGDYFCASAERREG